MTTPVLHQHTGLFTQPDARGRRAEIAGTLIALLTGTIAVLTTPAVADKSQPLEVRKALYAPWSPDQMAQRRKDYGLIGPGTSKPVPPPAAGCVAS